MSEDQNQEAEAPVNDTAPLADVNNLIAKLEARGDSQTPQGVQALNALATTRQWLENESAAPVEAKPELETAPLDPADAPLAETEAAAPAPESVSDEQDNLGDGE